MLKSQRQKGWRGGSLRCFNSLESARTQALAKFLFFYAHHLMVKIQLPQVQGPRPRAYLEGRKEDKANSYP